MKRGRLAAAGGIAGPVLFTAALAVFASRVAGPYNGVVQRIAVTLALTAELLIAVRMLTRPATMLPGPDRSDRA